MKKLLALAILTVAASAFAGPRSIKLASITASGDTVVSPVGQRTSFDFNWKAGTGIITLKCRLYKSAPFFTLTSVTGTTYANCTSGTCNMQNAMQCESYDINMSTCVACNV